MCAFVRRQSGVDLNKLHEQFSAIAQRLIVDPTIFSGESSGAEWNLLAEVSRAAELVARLPAAVVAVSSSAALRTQADALADVAECLADLLVADCESGVFLSSRETYETVRLANEMVSLATRIILVLARIADTHCRRRYVVLATLRAGREWASHAVSAALAANSLHLPLLPSHRCVAAMAVIRLIVSIWLPSLDLLRSTPNRAPRKASENNQNNENE